jgi:hypothetical protein
MKYAVDTILGINRSFEKNNYEVAREDFKTKHDNIASYGNSKYVLPFWQAMNGILAEEFKDGPPFEFLNHKLILNTMFASDKRVAKEELETLENTFLNNYLRTMLQEHIVGNPMIYDEGYLTSCNRIHQLYHIWKFLDQHGLNSIGSQTSVVEWGGGYGAMALLFKEIIPNPKQTYYIIDLPIFCCIQYLYLSTILGKDNVKIVTKPDDILDSKINLIPIGLLDEFRDIVSHKDLFIAMWSLSESSPAAYNLMVETDFLSAKDVMLAFHSNKDVHMPSGSMLYEYAKDKLRLERTGFVDRHYYGWR